VGNHLLLDQRDVSGFRGPAASKVLEGGHDDLGFRRLRRVAEVVSGDLLDIRGHEAAQEGEILPDRGLVVEEADPAGRVLRNDGLEEAPRAVLVVPIPLREDDDGVGIPRQEVQILDVSMKLDVFLSRPRFWRREQ